ncbi:hypothetical protein J1N35_045651 [Gossypium stocksii]|uniref:Isopenicillin N synthase-like Fe(2+) 2OG dioxygenase domain-containing protein n=1 Tax=Gossypium stocksii TaxID=47602 RepID=A0A9D3UBK4_9ROSI|nr:hypothetical protein J1N35_045651 [Gossypium stocksii]
MPNEGTIIKAPKELIDEEHPQLFRDFDFMKFFFFAFSNPARHIDSGQLLYDFAALSPPVSNAHMDKRLKSVNHRVLMSRDKDGVSITVFVIPNKSTINKTTKELIDDQHPRDFDFMKFFFFSFSDPARRIDSGQLLYDFAALSPPVSN